MRPRAPASALFPYTTLFRSPRGRAATLLLHQRYRGSRTRLREVDWLAIQVEPYAFGIREYRYSSASAHRGCWHRGKLRLSGEDRKSTRLNSSHGYISYAVFC